MISNKTTHKFKYEILNTDSIQELLDYAGIMRFDRILIQVDGTVLGLLDINEEVTIGNYTGVTPYTPIFKVNSPFAIA